MIVADLILASARIHLIQNFFRIRIVSLLREDFNN